MTHPMPGPGTASGRLPEPTRSYLAHPELSGVWQAVRNQLERRGLAVTGSVTVDLDEAAAARLNGLVGAVGPRWRPGRRRVDLTVLDRALRSSAAAAGLVCVVAELTGPLVDRAAVRAAEDQVRSDLWSMLDDALARAGLAGAPWVAAFTEGLRRSGLLTRAGADAARVVAETGTVLAALDLARVTGAGEDPADGTAPVELGELATRATGDAHGLDEGRVTPRVVLRAAAAAGGVPVPATAAARRELWTLLGVVPDRVSGTVLTWGLRPPGDGQWAQSMRARADLGVVTHLTLQELDLVGVLPADANAGAGEEPVRLVGDGVRVWACENPQVVQAAARAGVRGPLVCTSGNPSGAGWRLLSALVGSGVEVGYHGDFDWPGIAIADRMYRLGVRPWRMGAVDYEAALTATAASGERLMLSGTPRSTPWDEALAAAMRHHQTGVHEEALTDTLLADLAGWAPPAVGE